MSVNVAGGDLQWDASIDLSGFRSQLAEIRNGLNSLADDQKKNNDDIANFARTAAQAAAGFFSIQAASNFVQSMVQVRGEFQQIEVAYRTMLGSKEKADQLMAESVKLAAVTPFGLQDVASGSKQLLAYGFAAKEITGNLEMLGNIASGVGSQLNDVVYLYGTLKSSGRVTQMDINQFAGRGIPIYQALADAMKINVEQVREYVSAGKVGFSDVERAFKSLTGAGGQFFNLMQEQSKTLTGQLSNLEDAWSVMLNELGKQNEGVFATAIGSAITLVENYEKVLDIVGALVVGYGTYRAALLLTAAATSVATYATAGFTAAEILQYYWTTTLTKAQRLLNLTMLANPYVAVASALAAIGTYLYLASEATDNLTKSQENLTSIQNDAKKSTIEQKQKLEDLLKVARDETKTISDREAALKKVNAVSPQFLGALTLAKLKTEEGKKAIDDYNKSIDLMALKQASFDKRVELQKQKADLLSGKAEDKLSFLERAEIGLKSGKSGDFANEEYSKAVKEKSKLIDKQLKDISDYEAKAVAEYNAKEAPAVKVLRNISFLDKEIESLKESQKSVATKKEFAAIQAKINKLEKEKLAITGESAKVSARNAKIEEDLAQKKLDILYEINQAHVDFNAKNKSENAKEIEENKKQYAELRKKALEYNELAKKEGKSTIGGQDLSMINNLESKEDYAIKYRQDTELLRNKLENDRKLIEDFEDFKSTFGEQKARERYGYEIKTNAELLAKLKSDNDKLIYKAAFGGGLTSGESDRLTGDLQAYTELKKQEDKRYADAYNSALTYNQNIERINEEYRQKAKNLGKAITDEQKLSLLKQRDDAIAIVKNSALEQSATYRSLAEETFSITRTQALEQVKVLSDLIASGKITGEAKKEVEKQLGVLKLALDIGVDQANLDALKEKLAGFTALLNGEVKDKEGNPIILTSDQAKGIIANIKKIKGEIDSLDPSGNGTANFGDKIAAQFSYLKKGAGASELFAGLSADLGQVSGAFGELSNSLGGVNTNAGYALDTLGQLAGVASDAAGAASSFASGDIIGGVTKTIKAVAGIFSIGKKVKEMNAAARQEVEDFYANAISGEREYQDLLAERELQTIRQNKLVLQGIRDELALRKQQSSAYQKEVDEIMAKLQGQSFVSAETYKHGTWFRKAQINKTYSSLSGKTFAELSQLLAQGKLEGETKVLVERLKEIEEKGYDAVQAMAELARETNEFFTGTSADTMTNSFADILKNPKAEVLDFTNFFEQSMEDAAMNIFKNNILAKMMEKFYEDFANSAISGDTLDAKEIEELRTKFLSMSADAQKEFEKLKEVTGLSFSDVIKEEITTAVKEVDNELQSLSDSIVDLFSNTDGAFENFETKFNNMVKDSLLKSMQQTTLQGKLADFMTQFNALDKVEDTKKKSEVERLRQEYNKIISESKEEYERLQEVFGVDLSTPKQSQGAISSSIERSITEDTANVLSGTFLGIYEENKRISSWMAKAYSAAIQNIEIAINIEKNTRRGADNTDGIGSKLDQIINNTRKSQSSSFSDNYLKI